MVDPANGCGSGKSAVGEGGSSEYESRCGLESGEESTVLNTGDDEGDGSGDGSGDENIVVGSYEDGSRGEDQRLILRTIARLRSKLKTQVLKLKLSRVKTVEPRLAFSCPINIDLLSFEPGCIDLDDGTILPRKHPDDLIASRSTEKWGDRDV